MIHHKIFPAELERLYEMLAFIEDFVFSHKAPSSFLDQIILATEEALVNIINYGYPDQTKGTIEITCENIHQPEGIKIIIKDQGIPFNPIENIPSSVPLATEPHRVESSVGGYGIYILVGLMNHVEYQRVNNGNILSLTKYL